mmetsp:Transcript_3860/g.4464  ORF Transcript_3860/g.4464 Transcript_3860/m.4464 type:complete len:271 (-) Transcript_3860:388-1200(-)
MQVMSKRSNTNSNHERFMASMTFTSMFGNCDCDECDGCPEPSSETVPPDIKAAVKDYKRQRVTSASQERILTFRDNASGISIWEIVMPPGAEPLTELGGSHRFVLVTHLPKNRSVKIIGSGIVGSSAEQSNRKQMNWSERSAYLYPSVGGKKIGWVNDKDLSYEASQIDDKKDILEGSADIVHDVVIYVIKATQNAVKETNKDVALGYQQLLTSEQPKAMWTEQMIKLFQKYLKDSDISHDGKSNIGMEISSEDADMLRGIIDDIVKSKK